MIETLNATVFSLMILATDGVTLALAVPWFRNKLGL